HAYWDSGPVLANLLAVAAGQGIAAHVVLGYTDAAVNALLEVDASHEAAIALIALGSGATPPPPPPEVSPRGLPTQPLSRHEVEYPSILEAHMASSLMSAEQAAKWRAQFGSPPATPRPPTEGESIESVILRRGSSRRFSHAAVPLAALQ